MTAGMAGVLAKAGAMPWNFLLQGWLMTPPGRIYGGAEQH